MKEIYIASDQRNRGIGRELMNFVARYAVTKNCSRFDWTVDETNPGAIAFYEEVGASLVTSKLYYRFSGEQLEKLASQPSTSSENGG